MSSERDELALELFIGDNHNQTREQSIVDWEWFHEAAKFRGRIEHYKVMADAITAAGYRKIFDGNCGLSNAKDADREAAEAWMRWANLVSTDEPDGIAAMKRMLAEFGYSKPRTITTAEELDALPVGSVVLDPIGLSLHKNPFTGWCASNGAKEIGREFLPEALPATVLYTPEPTA